MSPFRGLFPPHDEGTSPKPCKEAAGTSPKPRQEFGKAKTVDKGHGRIETRTIHVSSELNEYLDWPGVQNVFRLERKRKIDGKETVQVVYGITSLNVTPMKLLDLVRTHWGIENSLHWVRDTTFGEDRCRVRKGTAPIVLASIRNVGIRLLNRMGFKSCAEAIRKLCIQPDLSIKAMSTPI